MQNFYLTSSQVFDNVYFWGEDFRKDYVQTIERLLKTKPFGDHKFYVLQFVKRVDDGTGVKKMYHFPRLTKPFPVAGTTCIKLDPKKPEQLKIVWTLPPSESFSLYDDKKIFGDEIVHKCIREFKKYLELCAPDSMKDTDNIYGKYQGEMFSPEPDDLSDDEIREIYKAKAKT